MMVRRVKLASAKPVSLRRRAVAVVETAFILPFLMYLMFGVWEVGRLLHIQQIIANAARDGARYGSTGLASASNIHKADDPLESKEDYQVQRAVLYYLQNANLSIDPALGLSVEVANETKSWSCTYDGAKQTGTSPSSDPCLSSSRMQMLRVEVKYPYKAVAWSPTQVFVSQSIMMKATVRWPILRDDPISTDSSIPVAPLD